MEITYYCSICKENHVSDVVSFKIDPKSHLPFPLTFIHINPHNKKEIYTQIHLNEDFSAKKVFTRYKDEMNANPLLKEIIFLEDHFKKLKKKYDQTINQLKNQIESFEN